MSITKPTARILVVEDEVDIQQVMSAYLKYAGFEVHCASNGQEAIEVIPEFSPDLVLLDIKMQPVSGWEVLDWLRTNHFTPPLPVLVITALVSLTEQLRGFEEGAIDYITKPTRPSVIVERVSTLLSLSVEQRVMLQRMRMEKQRQLIEHIRPGQSDEFVY